MTVLGTDFLAGLPVVFAVTLLVLLCRWVFGSHGVKKVVARPDYGLLCPVARRGSAEQAHHVCRRLAEHGIRGTIAPAGKGFDARGVPWPPGSHVVLVFPSDVERAAELLVSRR